MDILDNFSIGNYELLDQFRFNIDEMPKPSTGQIAVVGLPNTGKKTICNSLWGWDAVQANGEMARNFGLFTLIDLPLDPYDVAGILYRLENTDLIIFVLDAEQGLDPDSFHWIARLRGLNAAMLVVVNKADRIADDRLKTVLEHIEVRSARPVIPLKAVDAHDVRSNLLSAILRISPEMAVPLATEISSLRHSVALHLVMQAVMSCLTINLEVNTRKDSSVLVGLQLRLIRQIAAIYGYKEQTGIRKRMGLSVVLRWGIHLAIKHAARIQHFEGRIGMNVISVITTFVVGRSAMLVYGGQLPAWIARYTPQAWRAHHAPANSTGKP
jgi:hypothetical protein